MNSIGERLLYVRNNILLMTQKDFAKLLGISQGALSDMENNNRGLSMEVIIKLLEYSKSDIHVSCDWILTGNNNTASNHLSVDEKELLTVYRELDNRGKHKMHSIGYEELDRVTGVKPPENQNREIG